MKRFYKTVTARKTAEGYKLQLDDRSVKTDGGQELIAPSKALGEAVAEEWRSQGDKIDPATMPLTQLLGNALDRMRQREEITDRLVQYLDTDLLCYRTEEPEALAERQAEIWGRWLDWFKETFGVVLESTTGLEALQQNPEAHKRVWNYIEALDEYYFAVLHIVTTLGGSVVLGLAFLEAAITPEELFDASELEELYHAGIVEAELAKGGAAYIPDPQQEQAHTLFQAGLHTARRFLDLLE